MVKINAWAEREDAKALRLVNKELRDWVHYLEEKVHIPLVLSDPRKARFKAAALHLQRLPQYLKGTAGQFLGLLREFKDLAPTVKEARIHLRLDDRDVAAFADSLESAFTNLKEVELRLDVPYPDARAVKILANLPSSLESLETNIGARFLRYGLSEKTLPNLRHLVVSDTVAGANPCSVEDFLEALKTSCPALESLHAHLDYFASPVRSSGVVLPGVKHAYFTWYNPPEGVLGEALGAINCVEDLVFVSFGGRPQHFQEFRASLVAKDCRLSSLRRFAWTGRAYDSYACGNALKGFFALAPGLEHAKFALSCDFPHLFGALETTQITSLELQGGFDYAGRSRFGSLLSRLEHLSLSIPEFRVQAYGFYLRVLRRLGTGENQLRSFRIKHGAFRVHCALENLVRDVVTKSASFQDLCLEVPLLNVRSLVCTFAPLVVQLSVPAYDATDDLPSIVAGGRLTLLRLHQDRRGVVYTPARKREILSSVAGTGVVVEIV